MSGIVTKINISGGEISSTNYTGIQADTCATIYIKGAAVIRGARGAMNTVPETNPYDGWGIWASTNYDGSNPTSEFDPANINQYKYVEYVSPPITYEATIYAYKNGSAWTDVANDKIVLSTSATNGANDHYTVTPVDGTFAYDNLAALPLYIWVKNNAGTYVKIGSLSFLNCNRSVNYYDT